MTTTTRDANGRSRHAAGAPASIGGRFATERAPDAAITLDAPSAPETPERAYDVLFTRDDAETAVRRIEQANRRLERAGIAERFTYDLVDEPTLHEGRWYDTQRLALDRPRISYGEWALAGVHEATPSGELITHRLGGDRATPTPDDMRCDYCGHRRARTRILTITHPRTGEVKHVGSNCVELFLGVKPEGLWALSFDPDSREGQDWYANADTAVMHRGEDVLLAALRASDGGERWRSRSSVGYGERSTVDDVRDALLNAQPAPTPDEGKQLDALRAWVAAIPADTDESFLANVRASLAPTSDGEVVVRDKHVGLASAAVAGWASAKRREARDQERRTERSLIVQEHVGQPGDVLREHGLVTVVRSAGFETDYGYMEIITMRDDRGRLLKWRTSAAPAWLVRGATATLERASVKSHDEYDGNLETTITRAKLIQGDEPATVP